MARKAPQPIWNPCPHVGATHAFPSFRACSPSRYAANILIEGLEPLLIDRSPDFLVVLDGELRVVRASAGLRSAVPLVTEGQEFLRSLDDASQARLRQALSLDREATGALALELVHRGREAPLAPSDPLLGLEPPFLPGGGRRSGT